MTLVTGEQKVTLYQVGDMIEGASILFLALHRLMRGLTGASFNNLLDALDDSYCTYEGGDDPSEDGIYPDSAPGGYNRRYHFFSPLSSSANLIPPFQTPRTAAPSLLHTSCLLLMDTTKQICHAHTRHGSVTSTESWG